MDVPAVVIVVLALAVYVPLRMFLEPMSIMLITLPILHPIVVGALGFSSIWFGVLVTKLIEVALITPPVGLNIYVIAGIAPAVPLENSFRGISWFLLLELVALTFLVSFPALSTWLSSTMYTS